MAYANSADPDQSLIRIYTVCHSTKYFKKQLHQKQKLCQKCTEQSVRIFRTYCEKKNPPKTWKCSAAKSADGAKLTELLVRLSDIRTVCEHLCDLKPVIRLGLPLAVLYQYFIN